MKILIALVLTALFVSPAFADELQIQGWKTVFGLSCCSGTLEVGANDKGSGLSRLPITGPVNAEIADGYSSVIHLGSLSSFVENIYIEPQGTQAPKIFELSWSTYTWDPLWFYRPGRLSPKYNVVGVLTEGDDVTILDLNCPGSTPLMAGYQQHLVVYANPIASVPEPGSLLAMMTGLVGLISTAQLTRRRNS